MLNPYKIKIEFWLFCVKEFKSKQQQPQNIFMCSPLSYFHHSISFTARISISQQISFFCFHFCCSMSFPTCDFFSFSNFLNKVVDYLLLFRINKWERRERNTHTNQTVTLLIICHSFTSPLQKYFYISLPKNLSDSSSFFNHFPFNFTFL